MINLYEHDIDIYCSNVGIGSYEDFLKLTNEQWKNMIDTNLMSHIYGVRHVLPKMLDRGSGHLVFTASAAGLLSQLGSVTYSVTKHAVVSLAEWLKITYGKLGIGVSCICPQAVRTAMTAQGAGVAGIDGMIEPDVVANDTLEAIQNDQFLVTPHKEVIDYIQFKAADYEGWIEGMQNLQEQYIDEIKSVIK
jgi:short-subunit dehydrogenase